MNKKEIIATLEKIGVDMEMSLANIDSPLQYLITKTKSETIFNTIELLKDKLDDPSQTPKETKKGE